jgi:cytochrome c-type biogenesis protein CcsB
MKWPLKVLPWLFVALFGADIVAVLLPKKEGQYHVQEFGRLPVLLDGRLQPYDTMARNALLQIRSTGSVPLEQGHSGTPRTLAAAPWLLEVMTRPDAADTRPIFLIHNPDLLEDLKLQNKGIDKSGLRYYTYNDLSPVLSEIAEQGKKAEEVKSEEQTAFQRQAAKLANALMIYQRLKVTLQPEGAPDLSAEIQDFQKNLPAAQVAAQASASGKPFDRRSLARIAQPVSDFRLMNQYAYALIVPSYPKQKGNQWQNMGASILNAFQGGGLNPAVKYLGQIATAYHQKNPRAFNTAVAKYRDWLKPDFSKELRKGRAEYFYNSVNAFLHATIIYIFAFILAGTALLLYTLAPQLSESLRLSAFYLVILAGAVHTFGLIFRMVLEGRPPVTNLYSSAIFIGWGAMVLGIILERIYRVGIGTIVASLVGFITLLIAHNLALGGDTMEMLRAVLDTNFWLATHVVVITLGYASTFAAGLLAIIYIFLGLFTPLLTQKLQPAKAAGGQAPSRRMASAAPRAGAQAEGQMEIGKALSKMVYGIVCFATLFSFVGTVLGGIWADQSWGRFWGWDPKENGALLIVLWNAIILHARWGGMVRERGIMNLAVFGNVITSFSWFGVNMLGIGLHSYGFMAAAFKWLIWFDASQLVIILMGLLPLSCWRSFRTRALAAKSAAVQTPGTPQPAAT